MTTYKKVLQTSVSIFAIAGMLLAGAPAHAGFFDWFKMTPLRQEAQALKATSYADEVKVKTDLDSNYESTVLEKEEKPNSVSRFFGSIFSSQVKPEVSTVKPSSSVDLSSQVSNVKPADLSPASSLSGSEISQDDLKYHYVENILRYKDQSREVLYVQQVLNALGYYKGRFSGLYDDTTVAAVKEFQRFEQPVQALTTGRVFGKRTIEKFNTFVDKLNGGGVAPIQSCSLTPSQIGAILNLLDSFSATTEAIQSVEDILATGSTNIVMTAYSGLTEAQSGAITSILTSFGCDNSTIYLINDILTYIPGGHLGQISFWYGKVNLHRELGGLWTTDPDGVAGAGTQAQWGSEGWIDRKVEYCQRFWPDTTSVEELEPLQVYGWLGRGNTGQPLSSNKMVYNCVGQSQNGIVVSLDASSPSSDVLLDSAQDGMVEIATFKIANNTNEDIWLSSVTLSETEGDHVAETYHIQAENPGWGSLGPNVSVVAINNQPVTVYWNNGVVVIPANDYIRLRVRVETRNIEFSPAYNNGKIRVEIDNIGDVEAYGLSTGTEYQNGNGNVTANMFYLYESYPEFEWQAVSNTTLNSNTNHLFGKLKIRVIGNEDVTFQNSDGNKITIQVMASQSDDTNNSPESLLVHDESGNALDLSFMVENGLHEFPVDFSLNDLTISAGSSETLFFYLDSTDLEDNNDYAQLYVDSSSAGDIDFGIDGQNFQNAVADILWRSDHMSDNYSQVHINPS